MESSNLSLHIWFTALLLMSVTKKGFSCLEFQRQLGLKRYETAFNLMHKIRTVIGKRDDLYLLKEMVEYDEAAELRSDNGPEFLPAVYTDFCEKNNIETQCIKPGKPMQNGFVEHFNRS